jgi:hypothetical protein
MHKKDGAKKVALHKHPKGRSSKKNPRMMPIPEVVQNMTYRPNIPESDGQKSEDLEADVSQSEEEMETNTYTSTASSTTPRTPTQRFSTNSQGALETVARHVSSVTKLSHEQQTLEIT